MNSYDVVLLYTKVNFFSGWPFLATMVSGAKRCHWFASKCNPIIYFRHKDNFVENQRRDVEYQRRDCTFKSA